MASEDHKNLKPGGDAAKRADGSPEWAGGLKQLYDSVVEEPLPDSFMDLLNQLDSSDEPLPDGKGKADGASGVSQ